MKTKEMDSRLRFAGRSRDELAEAISAEVHKPISYNYLVSALTAKDGASSWNAVKTAADVISRRWVAEKKRALETELSERYGCEIEIVPPIEGTVAVVMNGEYVGVYSLEMRKLVQ